MRVVRALLIVAAIGAGAWLLRPSEPFREKGILDVGPQVEFIETRQLSEADVEYAAKEKGIEYVAILIFPELPNAGLAKIPPEFVTAKHTGTFEGVERWETAGVMDHEGVRKHWSITFGFHERRFYAALADLDGRDITCFLTTPCANNSSRDATAARCPYQWARSTVSVTVERPIVPPLSPAARTRTDCRRCRRCSSR